MLLANSQYFIFGYRITRPYHAMATIINTAFPEWLIGFIWALAIQEGKVIQWCSDDEVASVD
jgi:hypothetical protein